MLLIKLNKQYKIFDGELKKW